MLGCDMALPLEPASQRRVLEALAVKMRLYVCPFALARGSGGGGGAPRGFAFLQIHCTLPTLALPAPRDCAGHALPAGERAVLVQFCTMAEYEAEIAPADAQLAELGGALAEAVATHDDHTAVVVVLRAACGFAALCLQPMVPEWRVARALADEYAEREALQIDLDADDGDVL